MLSGLLKRDLFAAIAALMTMFAAGTAGAVDTVAKQAIIADYQTGTVLFEKNADESIHPASMSKLMTLDILFEQLKKGQITLNDTFPVSERAWAHNEGSTMFVGINTQVRVEDLIRGIVVQSGNDACIVVAEGLSGTEEAFVEEMNKRAVELGLENSHFRNSHGLEDPESQDDGTGSAQARRAYLSRIPGVLSLFRRARVRLQQHQAAEPQSRWSTRTSASTA